MLLALPKAMRYPKPDTRNLWPQCPQDIVEAAAALNRHPVVMPMSFEPKSFFPEVVRIA